MLLENVRGSLDPNSSIAIAQRNKIVIGIGVMTAARAHIAGLQGPDKGLYVVTLVPGSLADRAGIVKGDVVLAFGGTPLNQHSDLWAAQAATKPGSKVKLTISRAGTEEDIELAFPAVEAPPTATKRAAQS
jgi:serine protease Do